MLDFQYLSTSNPTLAEDSNGDSTDLFVLTAQFGIISPKKKIFSGEWESYTGIRYQIFRYGLANGNETIGGLPIRDNDFAAVTLYSDLYWNKGLWQLRTGLRWTELENDLNGSRFYREFVPNWSVQRKIPIGRDYLLTVSYDGAWYLSKSEAFTFARDDLNDRLINGLSLSLLHRVSEKLYLEPSVRANYVVYSNDAVGDREDTILSVGVAGTYYFTQSVALRLFVNHQARESTGLGVADYKNTDAGLGGSLSFRF